MLKTETIRIAGYASAATLFSIAALTFPFVAYAQDVAQKQTPAGVVAGIGATTPSSPTSISLTDGKEAAHAIVIHGRTIADALQGAGITLGAEDRVTPGLDTPIIPATAIVITRIHFGTETETQPIPFRSVFRMSRDVSPGETRPGHKGVPGILTRTYRVGYVNGDRTSRRLISSVVTKAPVNEETLAGIRTQMARALPSRSGTYDRLRAVSMVATGYSPYEGSGAGLCATGMRAGYGVVAVDPRVIRLGSKLYVEGYGYAVAGDTGGAIKGHRIDLGHTTYSEAAAVGRRRVRVWVLAPSR